MHVYIHPPRYNMSDLNWAFFVDHKGDATTDLGDSLALSTKHFSGIELTLTRLRKVLTTEVHNLISIYLDLHHILFYDRQRRYLPRS
jgi:hypothetical protein